MRKAVVAQAGWLFRHTGDGRQAVLAGFGQTDTAAAIACATDDHIVYLELHTNADAGSGPLVNRAAS